MEKIGIITYHSAYNYGSVFQAYATQEALRSMGCSDVEIVNYRPASQLRAYAMYRTSYGVKRFVGDLSQLPLHYKRVLRRKRFEDFIQTYMNLGRVLTEPDEVVTYCRKFNIMVSGSDQIWNKHSLELEGEPWLTMYPYLLEGFDGRKVSYASSIGNMNDKELVKISKQIRLFDEISFREESSSKRVGELLGRSLTTVLDPTLLLTCDQYNGLIDSRVQAPNSNGYILVYCLAGHKLVQNLLLKTREVARLTNRQVIAISPFFSQPFNLGRIHFYPCAGPLEFLAAIDNADAVITNSFHGTAFSIIYNKRFLSITGDGPTDFRKTELLNRLGLLTACCTINEISIERLNMAPCPNDWKAELNIKRTESIEYLHHAIFGSELIR